MRPCPICNEPMQWAGTGKRDAYSVNCPRCGHYQLTDRALANLKNSQLTTRQRANISGWLFENQIFEITTVNLEWLINIMAPSFHDRADKLLLAIEKETEYAGQSVERKPLWLGASWCSNDDELNEILDYMQISQRIVIYDGGECKIAPTGWSRIEELKKVSADSNQCFVAMSFAENMNSIYDEAISKAICDAGYRPHRVDKREHTDKIDDEIIAQIRRSKFIVADFTGQRGNVYYEAGFAKGLGLEVIWNCRKDEINDLRFDIRQYNCIDWEEDKLQEFMKRLTNRIESVLGRGKYVTEART